MSIPGLVKRQRENIQTRKYILKRNELSEKSRQHELQPVKTRHMLQVIDFISCMANAKLANCCGLVPAGTQIMSEVIGDTILISTRTYLAKTKLRSCPCIFGTLAMSSSLRGKHLHKCRLPRLALCLELALPPSHTCNEPAAIYGPCSKNV